MEGPYTRTDLLAAMMGERGRWDALLDDIDARRMDEPGAIGTWSVKLVIAHIMGWERWATEQVRAAARGEPLITGTFGDEMFDAMNEEFVAPYFDGSPREVRAESDDVFRTLLGTVERLASDQLDVRDYAPWSPDQTISEVIAESTFKHYPEHMTKLREWMERGAS
ncbi:MAG: ClbS/DfsB family four-helix bundle protein [Thermomicrobiales bacterium]